MNNNLTRIEPYFAPIFLYQNAISDLECEELRKFCDNQEYNPSIPGNDICLHYSTNQNILAEFTELKEYFESIVQNISTNVIRQVTEAFSIKQSWITKTPPGGASPFHSHKNYYMAGVLYLQDNNQLILENPWQNLNSFAFEPIEQSPFNCLNSVITAPKNSLVFMPAHLKHQVPPWNGSGIRYSITMNIHPIGTYGVPSAFITV